MASRACIWNLSAANGRCDLHRFWDDLLMVDGRKKPAVRLHFPREVLLVEIERRCAFPDCEFRNRLSLTKAEAIEYRGFRCDRCDRWNDYAVTREELPSSWKLDLIHPSETSM